MTSHLKDGEQETRGSGSSFQKNSTQTRTSPFPIYALHSSLHYLLHKTRCTLFNKPRAPLLQKQHPTSPALCVVSKSVSPLIRCSVCYKSILISRSQKCTRGCVFEKTPRESEKKGKEQSNEEAKPRAIHSHCASRSCESGEMRKEELAARGSYVTFLLPSRAP